MFYEEKSTTKTELTDEEISVLSAEKEFEILVLKDLLTNHVEEMANLYKIYFVKGKVDDKKKKKKSFLLTNFRDNVQFKPAHAIQ